MPERKETIRPTDAEAIALARRLMRLVRHGALATLDASSGWPSASRVAVASDHDGAPLILISALSAHTGALGADPRCSLLLGEPGKGDPLAHPRISIACVAERVARDEARHARIRGRFLRRNPKSSLYADFPDFAFFRLEPRGASLNGGFGKAFELMRGDLILEGAAVDALAAAEAGAIEHMNADHGEAIDLYARMFGKSEGSGWSLTGLDVEGLDLVRRDEVLRIGFAPALAGADQLRPRLVEMAREARENAMKA